jgi:hypothetical protein
MFEKVTAHCQHRNSDVEILFVDLKKGKAKESAKTPIRCQSSAECPKSAFCKFVNPLSNRIPVDFGGSAEAV